MTSRGFDRLNPFQILDIDIAAIAVPAKSRMKMLISKSVEFSFKICNSTNKFREETYTIKYYKSV